MNYLYHLLSYEPQYINDNNRMSELLTIDSQQKSGKRHQLEVKKVLLLIKKDKPTV